MRAIVFFVLVAGLSAFAAASKALEIYIIDVEGGNATLFVTPSGESVLIDTGNGAVEAARDVSRIMAAMKDAGVLEIDHLITTHWHGDHFGGMAELASNVPIREYIDHGINMQPAPAPDEFLHKTYPQLYSKSKHTLVRAGDRISVAGVEWRIVTSRGGHIASALPGGGKPNPYCATFKAQEPDKSENAQSIGSHITFGKFTALHLGDLTWNKEYELMCPQNRIGTVDLWIVSHHGQASSNSEVLVHAIQPRVAIMNNGTRKGGPPEVMQIIHSALGLDDLWQLHFSQLSGQEYTVAGMFIANTVDDVPPSMPVAPFRTPRPGTMPAPPPVHNGPAFWIKVSALQDGTFTVTNTRNRFSKTYKPGN
jgi:beta-lactamase superfamily II metal-dependent hydrolase